MIDMNKISKILSCGVCSLYMLTWMVYSYESNNVFTRQTLTDSIQIKSKTQEKLNESSIEKISKKSFEEEYRKRYPERYVKYLIKANNLKFPDIVFAQAKLETGNFTSDLFLNANNCFGMKFPRKRTTWAKGEYKGHAKYRNIEDCIKDYKIWQKTYTHTMTRKEYLEYIDAVYSEVNDYVKRLKIN